MNLVPCLPNEIARECLIRVPYNQFSTVSAVCKGWKEEVESVQFHQQRKSGELSQAIPTTGSWSSLPPAPGFPDGLPLFSQCAGVGRNLMVIGGWNPTTWERCFVFDFISGRWHRGADMPGGGGGSCLFFTCPLDFDRKIFVAGGHDDEKNALESAMSYDLAKDDWAPLPDIERPRYR
uniref:F-box domain-containing protein n=1 Tax=Nelumbo nucifera TaxID=4432 RepID=A0A822YNQ9_NELNU|nr:TPA_asm: hypothetical protein HUJ06_006464 [Nelumbo nucifera]